MCEALDRYDFVYFNSIMYFSQKLYESRISTSTSKRDKSRTLSGDGSNGVSNDPVYTKYDFHIRMSCDLPIIHHRDEILAALDEYPVVVLQGVIGCGKTTQVPQFLLDNAFAKKKSCNIVVTQPRRISAISSAKRVTAERHWPPTTVVGYQVCLSELRN